MKVEYITRTEEEIINCDYREAVCIKINDKKVFEVGDGEPEDATLGRDFNDVYKIPELLEKAYEAGKNGEPYEFFSIETDDL